jgi:hypothetical protein
MKTLSKTTLILLMALAGSMLLAQEPQRQQPPARTQVQQVVKDDPGVIKIRMGRKKAHTVYSVPESAAQRIHTGLLNAA